MTGESVYVQTRPSFNPRPHAKGRLSSLITGLRAVLDPFQSTPPREGATVADSRSLDLCLSTFQSTPPREGATKDLLVDTNAGCRCFNPRPHAKGRHERGRIEDCVSVQVVSIHAPTRRGDLSAELDHALAPLGVSIHAPVKGRQAGHHRSCNQTAVSIHAPVKGRLCAV